MALNPLYDGIYLACDLPYLSIQLNLLTTTAGHPLFDKMRNTLSRPRPQANFQTVVNRPFPFVVARGRFVFFVVAFFRVSALAKSRFVISIARKLPFLREKPRNCERKCPKRESGKMLSHFCEQKRPQPPTSLSGNISVRFFGGCVASSN